MKTPRLHLGLLMAISLPLFAMGCAAPDDDAQSVGAAATADIDDPEALVREAAALARVSPAECVAKDASTGMILGQLSYAKELAKQQGAAKWTSLRTRIATDRALLDVVGTSLMFHELVDAFDDTQASLEKLLESGVVLRFYTEEESFELTYDGSGADWPRWATLRTADGRALGGSYSLSSAGAKIRIEFQPDQMSELAAMTFELYRHTPDADPDVFSYRLEVVKAEAGAQKRAFSVFPNSCRAPVPSSDLPAEG